MAIITKTAMNIFNLPSAWKHSFLLSVYLKLQVLYSLDTVDIWYLISLDTVLQSECRHYTFGDCLYF